MSDLPRCTAWVPPEREGKTMLAQCTNEGWVSKSGILYDSYWCGEHATELNGCPPKLVLTAATIRRRLASKREGDAAAEEAAQSTKVLSWRARVRVQNGKEEAMSEDKAEKGEAPRDDVMNMKETKDLTARLAAAAIPKFFGDYRTGELSDDGVVRENDELAGRVTILEHALNSHREHDEQRLVAALQKALGDRMDDIERTAHDRTWQVGERVAVLERDLKIVREREAENATMMRATRENDLWRAFERIESLEGRSSGKIAGNDVRCRVCGVAFTSTEQKLGHYAAGCAEKPKPTPLRQAATCVRRFWPAVVVGCVATWVAGTAPLWLPALRAWAGW